MNFKAVFQKINLNWSRKLTHNLTLPNVEFRTSWCRTHSQNPSLVYSTPSKLSALFCEPCSQKSRFSGTAKFSSLYTGAPRVAPRVLAVWAKTLRGQIQRYMYICKLESSFTNCFLIVHLKNVVWVMKVLGLNLWAFRLANQGRRKYCHDLKIFVFY